MRALRYFFVASCFAVTALEVSAQETHDLNEDLQSWSHMKRVAGYYTESGVYRGGLWRTVSNTESEVCRCLEDVSRHCLRWSMLERNRLKKEYGNCTCAATELPYCDRWECTKKRFDETADCTVDQESIECVGPYVVDTLTCACNSIASNQRYCSEWSCREDAGYVENEDYQCLEEDVTGEYCYRWKGNISSSFEIESSVCECFERGEFFCKHWECRERFLLRCAAHIFGWCSIEIGIGVGGGCGLIFLVLVGYCIRNPPDNHQQNDERRDARTFSCPCLPAKLPICFLHMSPVFKKFRNQVIVGLFLTLLFCLPWLIGVVVWGGVLACVIVVPVWIFVFIIILLIVYYEKFHKEGQVHPSSEV